MGVIATRDNHKHICCFFVSAQYQRKGIGKKLWEYVKDNSNHSIITVNSSPFAIPVYNKLGFENISSELLTDGIRYIPMKFIR
ncbi:MAG: GNAT family N-acetyltransferase [Sedimentibacter sp.]